MRLGRTVESVHKNRLEEAVYVYVYVDVYGGVD
jgi:hypothetical protein